MQGHSLTCTFCRRSEHEVQKLVAGPGVYICDACVEIAHGIVHAEGPPPASEASRWRRAVDGIGALLVAARGRLGLRRARAPHAV